MTNVPEGAQLSEDGFYWWDGNEWKPVEQASDSPSHSAHAGDTPIDTSGLVATLSEIAAMDEEAIARSSSATLDTWIANLQQWHDYLSQSSPGVA